MSQLDYEEILAEWSKVYLKDAYADWSVEVDPSIDKNFAAIALFIDYRTAKSAGETADIHQGFKKASLLILDLLEIQIVDEPNNKIIRLVQKQSDRIRDKKLAKEIWG
ncbi:MAG: hypothetical protein CMN79_02750 [Spirochaetales bacterium]|jgi:hypothetical protein|nr:hypothetical protein [Spirochaetales bacterium]|tara:strand:+ start:613 stop:936 length:324 start_codon:yes stop_codon:yes gene_type:complete